MTQKQLVLTYVSEFGSIIPAKISGFVYKGMMFGSETSKRCRELRAAGLLQSRAIGKFEEYYLQERIEMDLSEMIAKRDALRDQYKTAKSESDRKIIAIRGRAMTAAIEKWSERTKKMVPEITAADVVRELF